jgi:hypothetical protein
MKPMSKSLQAAWDEFARHANWGMLHAYDEERFARFVRTSVTARRADADFIDFDSLVAKECPGWTTEEVHEFALELTRLYDFGRIVTRVRARPLT